ncbi:MAG: DNRLRE domain-containing protein [Clostridia bacterium]|nr:DNRLRE domain-containing protein [Clostridia bacterium]
MARLTLTPLSDAYVSQGSSSKNFGESSSLFTGQVDGTHQYKFYIKFDLSKIPAGAQNITASLKLFVYRKDNTTGPDSVTIRRITTRDFIESTVTYSTTVTTAALSAGDTSSLSIATADVGSFVSATLTNTVTEWYEGANANYGLEISGPATDAAIIGMYSRNNSDLSIIPYLEISYDVNYAPVYTITAQTTENILPTEDGAATTGISVGNVNGTTYIVTNTHSKTCTVQLQCSNDNTAYANVASPITLVQGVPTEISANIPLSYVRLLISGVGFVTGETVAVQAYTRQ